MISKLPFHGRVSSLDSMKSKLFDKLNITNEYQHVTLYPLIEANKPISKFVFSIGSQEDLSALDKLESLSQPLLSEIS